MKNGFTIILCCYNSVPRLKETIRHVSTLKKAVSLQIELLAIDNASTDGTANFLQDLWITYGNPFPLRIIHEPNAGLSHARMKGIKNAHFDNLIFCDDDNWLHENYLLEAYEILSNNPDITMVGGKGSCISDGPIPKWREHFKIFGFGSQAPAIGEVKVLYGAGVVLRRSAFLKLLDAGFDFMLTDRKKNILTSGGDYELCCAVKLGGGKLWFSDRLQFEHFISQERFKIDYLRKFMRESSSAIDILNVYRHFIKNENGNEKLYKLQYAVDLSSSLKRMIVYYWRYQVSSKVSEERLPHLFRYLYHKHRIKHMMQFYPKYGFYFNKIKNLQTALKRQNKKTQKEVSNLA